VIRKLAPSTFALLECTKAKRLVYYSPYTIRSMLIIIKTKYLIDIFCDLDCYIIYFVILSAKWHIFVAVPRPHPTMTWPRINMRSPYDYTVSYKIMTISTVTKPYRIVEYNHIPHINVTCDLKYDPLKNIETKRRTKFSLYFIVFIPRGTHIDNRYVHERQSLL